MFLILASLATLASAAPRVLPNTHFTQTDMQEYASILPNLEKFGTTMKQFHIKFNSAPWKVAENLQYALSMPMPGYKKEDIEIMAQKGALIMKAIHKEGDIITKSQIVLSVLPERVNPAGQWTFDGVLRVAFPIGDVGNIVGGRDDVSSDVIPIVIDE